MTKRKSRAEKEQAQQERMERYLEHVTETLECGRQQGRDEMKMKCENNRRNLCGGDDCCSGSHAKWIDEVDKSVMLDEICDPEPLSGYSLLDEIEFTLYSAQSELNRLQKLIFKYREDQK